jgi:hypothetical protein
MVAAVKVFLRLVITLPAKIIHIRAGAILLFARRTGKRVLHRRGEAFSHQTEIAAILLLPIPPVTDLMAIILLLNAITEEVINQV